MYATSLSRGCHHATRGCQLYTATSPAAARPGRTVQRRHRSASAVHPPGVPAAGSTSSCAACGSARVAAARGASTALHLSNANAAAPTTSAVREKHHLGGPPSRTPPSLAAWDLYRRGIPGTDAVGASGSSPSRALHAASRAGQAAESGVTPASLEARAALLGSGSDPSSWSGRELAGAILFAGAATAASILLGPFDALRGKSSGSGGGGGGGPGGDGGGGGGGVPPLGGKRYDSAFESQPKERLDEQKKLSLEVATSSRPYEVRCRRAIVQARGMQWPAGAPSPSQISNPCEIRPSLSQVSVRALRGGRLSMEDEFVVVSGGRLAAVFDGHGGGGVSRYLRDRMHVLISDELSKQEASHRAGGRLKKFMFGKGLKGGSAAVAEAEPSSSSPQASPKPRYDVSGAGDLPLSLVEDALRSSFARVDAEILADDEYEYQGSTAVAALLHESKAGARTLLSANVGDSRGVLSRSGRAVDLTRDHKPNDEREKARILAMGERVEYDHYCKVYRVRNLSLSRAIGDRFAKPAVTGEVEVKRFPLRAEDEFVLLASDGLWDVMSSQEVVSYVHKRLDAAPKDGADVNSDEDMANLRYLRRKNMSRFIANEALRRGSGDNISVVIVWLKEFDHAL